MTNLDSIIHEIRNGQKIAKYSQWALGYSQATAKVIIHEIMLYYADKQSLEDIIKYFDEAITIKRSYGVLICQDKELSALLNFQDNEGNTLLHYVASHGQHKNIKTLIKYGANPLIKNRDGEIPLDLAQGETRKELIKGMMEQASSKKVSARYDALGRTVAVSLLTFIVFGVGVGIAAQCDVVSFPNGMLGLAIASPFIGIAAGLITYFLDHDRKQAKAISTLLQESEVSKKSPSLQPSMQ